MTDKWKEASDRQEVYIKSLESQLTANDEEIKRFAVREREMQGVLEKLSATSVYEYGESEERACGCIICHKNPGNHEEDCAVTKVLALSSKDADRVIAGIEAKVWQQAADREDFDAQESMMRGDRAGTERATELRDDFRKKAKALEAKDQPRGAG